MFFFSFMTYAGIPSFTVGPSLSCETGSAQFVRDGDFGVCWDFSGQRIPAITNVTLSVTHNLDIRDIHGNSVYSYTTGSNTSNVPVTTGGEPWVLCALVDYQDVLQPFHHANIVPHLPEGTYYIYTWDNGLYFALFDGIPQNGVVAQGSQTVHQGSITITSEDIALPIGDIEKVKINGANKGPYLITDCQSPISVDFHVENVSPVIGNLYTVTASWAEVNHCNEVPISYSEEKNTSIFIPFGTYPNEQILSLGNILAPNVLDNNPFLNSNNTGKYFKVKFVLNNPRCGPEEVEICVLFTGPVDNIIFELQECSNDSLPSICSGNYVPPVDTPPGPTLGLFSGSVKLSISNGGFDQLLVMITSEDQTPHLKIARLINVDAADHFVTDKLYIQNINNWIPGDFKNLSDDGYNNFMVEVFLINSCTSCLEYDEEESKMFAVPCDFDFRLEDVIESVDDLIEVVYEPGVFEVEDYLDAYAYSYFNTIDSLYFMPEIGEDIHAAMQVEDFNVFPNPFNSELTFSNGDYEGVLSLLSGDGKLVWTQSIPAYTTHTHHIPNLKPGIYVYQFVNKNGITSGKVVKQ